MGDYGKGLEGVDLLSLEKVVLPEESESPEEESTSIFGGETAIHSRGLGKRVFILGK